jgi:hypothetical protein
MRRLHKIGGYLMLARIIQNILSGYPDIKQVINHTSNLFPKIVIGHPSNLCTKNFYWSHKYPLNQKLLLVTQLKFVPKIFVGHTSNLY